MNMNNMGTQLLYTTMPIWIEKHDGSQATGTGCVYMQTLPGSSTTGFPFLITNSHVVENARRGVVDFARGENDQPLKSQRVRVEVPGEMLRRDVSQVDDLVAIPIGPVLNQVAQQSQPVFFRSITPNLIPNEDVLSNLSAIEEIIFIGYPSGLIDQHNVTPLVRKGITSTPVWNDYENRPCFLIDAGVYPGSSGSPVFIYNQGAYSTQSIGIVVGTRLLFLGIITEAFIRSEQQDSKVWLGLGKVLKSARIKQFIDSITSNFPASPATQT